MAEEEEGQKSEGGSHPQEVQGRWWTFLSDDLADLKETTRSSSLHPRIFPSCHFPPTPYRSQLN